MARLNGGSGPSAPNATCPARAFAGLNGGAERSRGRAPPGARHRRTRPRRESMGAAHGAGRPRPRAQRRLRHSDMREAVPSRERDHSESDRATTARHYVPATPLDEQGQRDRRREIGGLAPSRALSRPTRLLLTVDFTITPYITAVACERSP